MTCTTCKALLTGTAKFCASCGAPRPPPSESKPDANPDSKPRSIVDPLAMTAPDAFAETANASTRAELDRALAAYDAKQQRGGTARGVPAPVATQEMQGVPSHNTPAASPQVSPKAASHVVPVQQPRTAAMPASAHKLVAASPVFPVVQNAQGGSPQARIPLAPGSSGGIPAMSDPMRASGPPAIGSSPGVAGAPPRLSPVPFPQPLRGPAPALAPGLPVGVTWANGQRYRGTVVQLLGARVLVVFPDGQQHWVEMSYISPA